MNSLKRFALVAVMGLTTVASVIADDRIAATTARPAKARVTPVAPEPGYDPVKMEAVQSYGSTLDLKRSGDAAGYDATVKMDASPSTRGGFSQTAADEAFLQHVWTGP